MKRQHQNKPHSPARADTSPSLCHELRQRPLFIQAIIIHHLKHCVISRCFRALGERSHCFRIVVRIFFFLWLFISRTGCLVSGAQAGRGFLKINLSGCFVVFSDKMALQPRTIKALVILVAGETAVLLWLKVLLRKRFCSSALAIKLGRKNSGKTLKSFRDNYSFKVLSSWGL